MSEHVVECPVCGCHVHLHEGVIVSELVDCQECGSELEVSGQDPWRLAEAPQAGEDWGE